MLLSNACIIRHQRQTKLALLESRHRFEIQTMSQPKPTVLVVDDNDIMRTLLRGILRGENFDVVSEGRNGLQAVDLAERFKPDIVCLDVMMPELDGMKALKAIREQNPECKVVMITSNASAETVQEAIQLGASGFIVKPFNAARVLDTLARILSRHEKSV